MSTTDLTSTAEVTTTEAEQQRDRFYRIMPRLLAENPRSALVLAQVGAGYLDPDAVEPVADRVINLGIREQLLIGVTGGLALAGLRPIAHTFGAFLIERPFEQVKLDLGHQDVGAVLVSAGGSYGWPAGGETHFGHRDVALLDTLAGWTVHVPGHPDEAESLLRTAINGTGRVYLRLDNVSNDRPHEAGMQVLRSGNRGTVIAVGPMADRVLAATEGLDLTVLYTATVRPFDARTLRAVLTEPDVVLVEPYLAGTSVGEVDRALADRRHRVLGLGVSNRELRRYGSVADHDRLHGLDVTGLREQLTAFIGR